MALLRKVELHPAVRNWTPGRLAANLIHKFRFDGIRYDRCVDTSTGALPLVLDLQSEVPKMALVWQFIEGKMDIKVSKLLKTKSLLASSKFSCQ